MFDMFYIVVVWSCMERSLSQLLFIAILVKLIWLILLGVHLEVDAGVDGGVGHRQPALIS